MISKEFIDILVCPETKQKLRLLGEDELAVIAKEIDDGKLVDREGELIKEEIDQALLREDGVYAYVVRNDIPIMLVEKSFKMPIHR